MAQNAVMRLTLKSQCLRSVVDVNVLYPARKKMNFGHGNATEMTLCKREGELQVLYLLHGGGGDYSDWLNNTRLALFAEDHPSLLIVMPTIKEFQNFRDDVDYYKYVLEELPEYIGRLFPISKKREDTFIAGLSMGGYLSYRIAMLNPEKYGCVGSFSSPLDIVQDMIERHMGADNMFSPDQLRNDPFREIRTIVDNNLKKGVSMPKTFQSCGTEDMTYAINCSMREFLTERIPDHTYMEGPGVHNWYFWDEFVEKFLNWLPLKDKEGK